MKRTSQYTLVLLVVSLVIVGQPARAVAPQPEWPVVFPSPAPPAPPARTAASCPPPAYTGGITGTVTAADTGAPLRVKVFAYSSGGSQVVYTDADGRYAALGLNAGSYRIEFEPIFGLTPPEYSYEWYGDAVSYETGASVPVFEGQIVPNINVALDRGTRISGRVTDQDTGQGLPGITVTVSTIRDLFTVAWGPVDEAGYYTTTAVRSGGYYLKFGLGNSWNQSDPLYSYAQEFYSDQPDLALANVVTVVAPIPLTGIDAALSRGAQIAGRITAAGSGLPVRAVVSVIRVGSSTSLAGSGPTDAQGNYLTSGAPTGQYILLISPLGPQYGKEYLSQYYNGRHDRASADVISLTAPNMTTGIDVVLDAGGAIQGSIVGMDLSGMGAEVTAYALDGRRVASAYAFATGVTTSTYRISRLPSGVYKVKAQDGGCARFLPRFHGGQTFDTATPVTVTLDTVSADINIQVEPVYARVALPVTMR